MWFLMTCVLVLFSNYSPLGLYVIRLFSYITANFENRREFTGQQHCGSAEKKRDVE